MRLLYLAAPLMLALASCATTSKEPEFDPDEIQIAGRVTHMEEALESEIPEPENLEMSNTGKFLTTMVIGVGTAVTTGVAFIPIYSYDNTVQGKPFKYHVKLENGKTLGLLNHYAGFKLDDCVKVFL